MLTSLPTPRCTPASTPPSALAAASKSQPDAALGTRYTGSSAPPALPRAPVGRCGSGGRLAPPPSSSGGPWLPPNRHAELERPEVEDAQPEAGEPGGVDPERA